MGTGSAEAVLPVFLTGEGGFAFSGFEFGLAKAVRAAAFFGPSGPSGPQPEGGGGPQFASRRAASSVPSAGCSPKSD